MKKLYFKVWQDKDSVGENYEYYIDTLENILIICGEQDTLQSFELPPIFEPIYMEEEEFKNLPEFKGY